MADNNEHEQSLEAQLAEARSVIDALRAGRVDAVVGEEHVALLRLREVEEALRRSEARYRAVVDAQADLVYRWDPDGRLTFVNEAYCRFLQQPRDALVGRPVGQTLPPGADHAGLLKQLMGRTERAHLEQEHRTSGPDGDLRWLQVSHRLIRDDEGQPAEVQSVARDITERRRAQEQLHQANAALEQRVADRTAQLQELVRELGQAEQRERRHLAQFLHDDLQQLLVAAKLSLGAVGTRDDMGDAQRSALEHSRELLTRSIAAARSLVSQLNPPALHNDGLVPALYWLADQMTEIHRLPVQVQADTRAEPDTDHVRDLLFASVRELLFNVIKHARASQAWLDLRLGEGRTIELEVRDDGVGFEIDPSAGAGGHATFGLWSIEERLRLLDGGLMVDSTPGDGSRVVLTAPASGPAVGNSKTGPSG